MTANTVRLATMRPDLYNQLLYNRMLPRGVVPIGGNPDEGFLQQVTMAMSMGAATVDEVAGELGALMKAKPPTTMREAMRLLSLALDLRHARPKVVEDGPCQ